jgi:glutamate synthase (NADPH/NADH) large chain
MSGGIAFVLDLDPEKVNTELVDVEPVSAEYADELHDILARHLELTGSTVARELLADYGRTLRRFSVLMPRDYKRVLEATRQAHEAGLDVDQAVMAAARG